MDYVREHIKRYWGMTYRRTLGVSLATFSVVIAIGLSFTVLTQSLAVTNYLNYFIFWMILILAAVLVFLANFFSSHTSSVKYMYEEEHRAHSKQMGTWMVLMAVGIIAFFMPLLFVSSYMEPVMLLFTLGGTLLVVYGSIAILFKHKYKELAIGWIAFWVMFLFANMELSNAGISLASKSYFSVYVATMSITIITGFVGLALLFNSANESMREFKKDMERIAADEAKPAASKGRKGKGARR
jgi:hypothetical protein